MANFDTIYTGKGLTPEFQSDGGKAMSRLSDFITRAEEIKYKAFKDNEEWFLNTQDIDSAFLISTKNQEVATQLMDTYNKESAAIYKRYNGNPPPEAKQEILAKKNFLIANQNKMIAKEKLAEQHKAIVEQNPLRYDKNKFYEQYDKFVSTGDYDLVTPPLKSKNPSSVFREQSKKLYPKSFETGTRTNKFGQRISQTVNIKDEDIPRLIEDTINYGDDQFIQGLTEEFLDDQSDEKLALMEDVDGDGQITENDVTKNAIIAWAQQNPKYIKAVKIEDELTPKNPPSSTSTAKKGGKTIEWGKGNMVVAPIGQLRKGAVNYGGEIRSSLYDFGGTFPLNSVPTEGGYYLYDTDKEKMEGGSNISGVLLDYDKKNDTLILRATTASSTIGVGSKQNIEIQASKVEYVNNLPIVVNGKQTTLGELRKDISPTINRWEENKRK